MKLKPFDPKFIGEGWTIESQDKDSLKIKNLPEMKLENPLNGEPYITGEEHVKRLTGIKMDARVFKCLWENQELIPESWKEKTNGYTTYIHFPGTILRDPGGGRYVLYLVWDDDQWNWNVDWLSSVFDVNDASALLASSLGTKKLSSKPLDLESLENRVKEANELIESAIDTLENTRDELRKLLK